MYFTFKNLSKNLSPYCYEFYTRVPQPFGTLWCAKFAAFPTFGTKGVNVWVLGQVVATGRWWARDSLGEGVEAVGLLGVGEGHPHARGEGRVQHHGGALVARRQVHGRHGADALAVHDHALRTDPVPEGGTDGRTDGHRSPTRFNSGSRVVE